MLGSDGGDIADKLKTLAKGGEVKKYMGGGSVQKKKNKMLTTKGWEHQEKHNELPVGQKRTHL